MQSKVGGNDKGVVILLELVFNVHPWSRHVSMADSAVLRRSISPHALLEHMYTIQGDITDATIFL